MMSYTWNKTLILKYLGAGPILRIVNTLPSPSGAPHPLKMSHTQCLDVSVFGASLAGQSEHILLAALGVEVAS